MKSSKITSFDAIFPHIPLSSIVMIEKFGNSIVVFLYLTDLGFCALFAPILASRK